MIDSSVFMTCTHITVFHTENKHNHAHKISNQLLSTSTPSTIFVIRPYATTTTMAFSLKKIQQRNRRQAAARRPPSAAHASILRRADRRRNNIRRVVFSTTCTAKLFVKTEPSLDVSASLVEIEEEILPHVPQPVPVEEEECVRFGNDAGHEEPAEPIARRKRKKRAARRREVASLRSDLGAYWIVAGPRVRREPTRFVP